MNNLQGKLPGIYQPILSSGVPGSGSYIGPWISTSIFALNDMVVYDGVLYKCIQAGINKRPDLFPDFWTIYDEQLVMHTVTDPAVNAAVSTAVIDAYAGVTVTLTVAGNAQTIQSPTNLAEAKVFYVVNDRTSTHNLFVTIPYGVITIEPGHGQKFFWTASEWVLGASPDAEDITAVPSKFNSADVQGQLDEISDIFEKMKEPTGVITPADITLTYSAVNRQFTIQPTAASFQYYACGKIFTVSAPETTTAHANTTGVYFLYYDETGTLIVSSTPWDFTVCHVMIAYVYYDSTLVDYILFEERHGVTMDQDTHGHLHHTVGTYVSDWGFGIADYNLSPSPVADSDNAFSIAQGTITDEDISSILTALPAAGPYSVWYRSGATGDWVFDKTRVLPFMVGATYIQYNQWTGATWQLTQLANNNYVNMYVVATPTWDKSDIQRFPIIVSQNVHTTEAAALAENIENLSLGDLADIFVEFTNLYKVTFRTNNSYASTGKCRIQSVVKVVSNKTFITSATANDHGSLSGLTDDDHLQYVLSEAQNCGIIGTTSPTFTDNLDGTFDIASCQVSLRSADGERANIYTLAAVAGLTPTDGLKSYLVVNYNAGSPEYQLITNVELIDEITIIPIYTIFRDGTTLMKIDWDTLASGLGNKLHQRFVKTDRFAQEDAHPAIITEVATREVNISACKIWHGAVRSSLVAFDSATDDWCFWYNVAGVWTRSAATTQYNNTQYDNGTNLVAANPNRYLINWIYRIEDVNPHAAYVLGSDEYKSLADAVAAGAPAIADLPESLQSIGFLVGRIIVKTSDTVASLIQNAHEEEIDFSDAQNFMIKQENTLSIVASAVDIAMDGKDYVFGEVTLTENVTINNPTGISTGSMLAINVKQDGTGGRTIIWGGYYYGNNDSVPRPNQTINSETVYVFKAVDEDRLVLISNTNAGTITNTVDLVTANTTIDNHHTILSNSATVLTHTLPAVAGLVGREYTLTNIGSASMILEGNGAETINGYLNVILGNRESITVQAYASGWVIV